MHTTASRRALHWSAASTFVLMGLFTACFPGAPRIDGVAGAPATPATTWTPPAEARTPPPPPAPPIASAADSALRADSADARRPRALSFADVIDVALNNNPATRESWAAARATLDEYGAARGALFPNINGSLTTSRTTSSAGAGGSSSGTGTSGTGTGTDTTQGGTSRSSSSTSSSGSGNRSVITPSLSLSYLVFDFGGRAGTIEAAKQRAIESSFAHNATVQDVVLQAESALFSFATTRALRDAQIIAVQEAQSDTAAAEARLRVGVGTLEEVLQTRTAYAQARLQLATLEGSLLGARASLAQAMGFQANARFDVPVMAEPDSVRTIAASVDTLINRAIVARPELAEARADAEALAAEIRVARSAGYPALTLSSTASYQKPFEGVSTTSSRNTSLVLGLQIPVFNGFAREYDVRAAREQYEAGMARAAAQRIAITVQVFTSYASTQTAVQRVLAADELLTSAQQSSDVALGRYQEGVGTIVDVLLARTALSNARASAIQARWEWQTSLAQLAHDVGVLDARGRATPAALTPPELR